MDARTDSSRRSARAVGAVIGLLVGSVPVALEHIETPLGAPLLGMEDLWVFGLVVGPLLGALFGPSVRAQGFQVGLAVGMAILAVVVGDVLFVASLVVAERSFELSTLAVAPILAMFGLVIVGPLALAVTAVASVAWQLLVRALLPLAGRIGQPVGVAR